MLRLRAAGDWTSKYGSCPLEDDDPMNEALGERGVRVGISARQGYTRTVSWRRPVTILALALLTGPAVSGTMCAMLCESAASSPASVSGHHHGSTGNADEPARPSTAVHIQSVSDHDCSSHDAALRRASTTVPERTDWGITSLPLATVPAPSTFNALTGAGPRFEYSTSPGTAPPTTTPLVLRV